MMGTTGFALEQLTAGYPGRPVLQGVTLSLGLSGGISLYPQHGQNLDELTRHADAAMWAPILGAFLKSLA